MSGAASAPRSRTPRSVGALSLRATEAAHRAARAREAARGTEQLAHAEPGDAEFAAWARSANVAALRAELAAAEAALLEERARTATREAEWLAAYNEVTADARELAELAHAAGVGAAVVDDWYVAPPEPEAEP